MSTFDLTWRLHWLMGVGCLYEIASIVEVLDLYSYRSLSGCTASYNVTEVRRPNKNWTCTCRTHQGMPLSQEVGHHSERHWLVDFASLNLCAQGNTNRQTRTSAGGTFLNEC